MPAPENKRTPQLGDVYMIRFGGNGNGSEQSGFRPGVVFQNNMGNTHSPNIIALPMTSKLKKTGQPTHVVVKADGTGLKRDSMVLCENPECISKERLGEYITTLSDEIIGEIASAHLMATSAIAYISPELLVVLWERAKKLNAVPVV